MKKTIIFLMALCISASFTACSSTENSNSISQDSILETTESSQSGDETINTESLESVDSDANIETASHILIAYFTYAENAGLPDNIDASFFC